MHFLILPFKTKIHHFIISNICNFPFGTPCTYELIRAFKKITYVPISEPQLSSDDSVRFEDVGVLRTSAPHSASFPSRQLVYTPGSPSSTSCPPLSPLNLTSHPAKLDFLVSFLVDARGGAMKGHRGSGMRLIIPQGKKMSDCTD